MTPSRFTPEQESHVVAEYLSGKSLRQIATAHGFSTRPVERVLKRHGIGRRPTGRHETAALSDGEIQTLRTEYDQGVGVHALAERRGLPQAAVRRAIESTGGVRRRGPGAKVFTDQQRAEVARRFLGGEAQVALAEQFGCGASTIARVLRMEGIAAGVHGQLREHHHNWKGGRIEDHPSGYIFVRPEPDDEIGQAMKGINGYVLEHRLVMAHALGRPLTVEETVHHGPGGKQDNRIENLELWASRHPRGQRVEELVVFAREILALYGDVPPAVVA